MGKVCTEVVINQGPAVNCDQSKETWSLMHVVDLKIPVTAMSHIKSNTLIITFLCQSSLKIAECAFAGVQDMRVQENVRSIAQNRF